MVAATKNATIPQLGQDEAKVFRAVGALRSVTRFGVERKRRFRLGLRRPRVRRQFLANAYEAYLEGGGRTGNVGEFVKWLLEWVVKNQDAIIRLIESLIAIFV